MSLHEQSSGGGIAAESTTALGASQARGPVPMQDADAVAGFRLLGRLGSGGMGTVWRARQEAVHREVALKLLDPHLARDSSFAERFMRESRAAARINHPQVVACYDAGRDGSTLWLAMELVAGGDAAAAMRARGGRLPEAMAVRLGIDCALGLAAIEAAGLIHRDIKPANVFLTAEGGAKLGDLGLARARAGDERMTLTGAPLGTPTYMSPEQARGERNLDIRSDIYSLGATLFELAVGQPPFRGETIYAVVSQVLNAPTPEARRLNPELSPGFSAVLARAMARRPQDRYAHPAELRAELERLREGIHPIAYSDTLGANLSSGLLVRPAGIASAESRPSTRRVVRRRSRWPMIAAAVCAIAMLAATALLLQPPRQAQLPPSSPLTNPNSDSEPLPARAPVPAATGLPPLSTFAPGEAPPQPAPAAIRAAPAPAATLPEPKAPAAQVPAAKVPATDEGLGLPLPTPPEQTPTGLESLPAPATVTAP